MATKNIIVLERQLAQETQIGDQAPQIWRYALWADVPVARRVFYADPAKTSAFKTISAGELASLRDGSVVERVSNLRIDKGATIPQLQTKLEIEWTFFQNEITTFNPWNRYGTFWDGVTWTPGGAS